MNHLTTLRKAANIKSINEAAERLGVSFSLISKIENNHRKPSPKLALSMTRLYNCSMDDIFVPYFITNSAKHL